MGFRTRACKSFETWAPARRPGGQFCQRGFETGMKDYSNWPTFPQLYIGGNFSVGATSPWTRSRMDRSRRSWNARCWSERAPTRAVEKTKNYTTIFNVQVRDVMMTNAVIMTNMCSCVVLISETRSLGVQRLVFLRRQTSLLQRHLARTPIDGVFTLGVFCSFC